MMPLPAPPNYTDDAIILTVCTENSWAEHHAAWQAAYDSYRAAKGNPWALAPAALPDDVKDKQYRLYDNQSSGPRLKALRQTRTPCCPMCGSPAIGTLDHYLPRNEYAEFAILAANLVPACYSCNSGNKRTKYKGVNPGETFIHPYFDTIAANPIWLVKTVAPYAAAAFEAVPMPNLSSAETVRILFHLENVLGWQFEHSMLNLWATFPSLIRAGAQGKPPFSLKDVSGTISMRLRDSAITSGVNSWETAFWRGLAVNAAASRYVLDQLNE